MSSEIIDNILANKNRTANLKVVFVDVVSYSKRRSLTQAEVIDAFMGCLNTALSTISQKYVKYAQDNSLNFQHDIICLPSGDGAAIVFPFDGLHDIHLEFSKELLRELEVINEKNSCEKFTENGWCNCHSNFNLTIGISEGKGIIYKDVNDNYNVAGNVINLAARIMGQSEKNQIMLSEEAYYQLIDLVDDPHLDEKFFVHEGITIKHNITIKVYQYIDKDFTFLNCEIPKKLAKLLKANAFLDNLKNSGFPIPDMDNFDDKNMDLMLDQLGDLISGVFMKNPIITHDSESLQKRKLFNKNK